MTLNIILFVALILAALWTVISKTLLKAAFGLAVTSVLLTIIMFGLSSPLAAMFELSVCAGLITAVFISAISLAKPLTSEQKIALAKSKFKKYFFLPIIIVVIIFLLRNFKLPADFHSANVLSQTTVNNIFWTERKMDLLGQLVILLAGVFGIVVLFKKGRKNDI